MLEVFKPKRVLIGTHKPGTVFSRERIAGIQSVLKKAGVQSEAIDTTLDPVKGVEVLKSYLMKRRDTDALFTVGTDPTHMGIDLSQRRNSWAS